MCTTLFPLNKVASRIKICWHRCHRFLCLLDGLRQQLAYLGGRATQLHSRTQLNTGHQHHVTASQHLHH